MYRRRVGTITFGVLLIILGLLYLTASILNINTARWILNLWPLILVSLGVEVLVLNRIALSKNIELKYDIISFLLIIIIFIFAFSSYEICTHIKNINGSNFTIRF